MIAYNPAIYTGDIVKRAEKLIEDINRVYRQKDITYKNEDKESSYHTNVGMMLFQEMENIHGLRSVQSVLDFLALESEDDDLSEFDEFAVKQAKNGKHILIGAVPARGDGGSELSNHVVDHYADYSFETDDLILKIGSER
jgi:hypothetical protein